MTLVNFAYFLVGLAAGMALLYATRGDALFVGISVFGGVMALLGARRRMRDGR